MLVRGQAGTGVAPRHCPDLAPAPRAPAAPVLTQGVIWGSCSHPELWFRAHREQAAGRVRVGVGPEHRGRGGALNHVEARGGHRQPRVRRFRLTNSQRSHRPGGPGAKLTLGWGSRALKLLCVPVQQSLCVPVPLTGGHTRPVPSPGDPTFPITFSLVTPLPGPRPPPVPNRLRSPGESDSKGDAYLFTLFSVDEWSPALKRKGQR